MHVPRGLFLIAFGMLVLLACDSQEKKAREEPLLPAETFNWCIIPLTFQPPPATWERQKHNEGGLRGVWFTHSGSVGERIYVSEYYKVGERSLHARRRLPYTLDEVVKETRFSTAGWPFPPDSFVVEVMLPDTIAGMPAYRLDFTLNTPKQSLVGREYYFLKKDHLFEASFLGLPVNMPLFDRVVETITFQRPGDP
ncbi:MAG: hypothetical protein KAH56_05755 [Candidatus Krumholzibacteria bacterium]|nr:hypothetical protein [Candidatus Krumholzibacteria bacterium]